MVLRAYGVEKLEFGAPDLIPKPLDPRLLCTVAPAVAKAAVESGVAKQPIAKTGTPMPRVCGNALSGISKNPVE